MDSQDHHHHHHHHHHRIIKFITKIIVIFRSSSSGRFEYYVLQHSRNEFPVLNDRDSKLVVLLQAQSGMTDERIRAFRKAR